MYNTIETSTQKARFRSLGNLESLEYLENGIHGLTSYGQFRILVIDHSIIRVSVTNYAGFDDFSYAVVGAAREVDFRVEERDDAILVSTALITLHISKEPVRFKFYDASGNIINEDDDAFGTAWIGAEVTAYKKLQEGERFVGLGEKTGDLDRRGQGYLNWNTDKFSYGLESDPLYCALPFYIGIHNNLAYGIFLDNSHKSHFNFGASNDRFSSFMAEDGDMDYYFIHNESVARILEDYTYLTGRMEIPPVWSIGYQQCRYSYYPDSKVLNVAGTFRQKKIPADVIVLDIHYMDNYKIFTWDPVKFPQPASMVQSLKDMNFHVVLMCDPGIKIEDGYDAYEEGKKEDVFLKYPDGTYFSAEVWPGWCNFPDFTHPKTRNWWRKCFTGYVDMGIDGFWNDMNEIASWGQMMPEHVQFHYEGNQGLTKKGRNVYGLQMARSTFEGTKKLLNGKRPFNLTRSAFSGIQRYSAVWTGDNMADDEHMLLGVRLVNSFGLTGVAFTGYDVGGFEGEASVDLFARWISIGAFSPFFRGHSNINSRDAEPWAFGETVEEISRNYINLRYQLMPYIYSLFFEATQTGMPVCRSLAIDYTHDDQIYDKLFQNQYLFGPWFLICPLPSAQKFCKVYLPEGEWYDFHSGKHFDGEQLLIAEAPVEKLPVFVKAGSIIPAQSLVQSTAEESDGRLVLHIYRGSTVNEFLYYEDDGNTYDFENGEYYKRLISYNPDNQSIKFHQSIGNFKSKFTEIQLILHGFGPLDNLTINGEEKPTRAVAFSYLKAITKFDPVEPKGQVIDEDVEVITIPDKGDMLEITW